ncbi:hypothetical protein EZV62_005837 [Acer yangbiense]|uniref:Glycosyltransferase n=1 Tax=Acer yangbiense TaxID=1000413 RepID=A0A5C7IRE2_9ROSI|nr:hypothetical protein EZV62_005837 [Acer yangbiense]
MSTAKPHILLYPFPDSGHIIPLLDLTRLLLTRGLTVTVSVTSENLPLLDPLLSRHASSLVPLLLPFPDTQSNRRRTLYRDLHYPFLLQWFKSHTSPPVVIVSDFFFGWTHQLACQVGVPRVVFSPSGAIGLSIFFTLWKDLPKVDDPSDVNSLLSIPNFPNCPVLPWYQVPQLYRMFKEGDPDWEFQRNGSLDNIASWGIVLNTSTCLEQVYIDHIKKQVGHDRVWAVGPVLPTHSARHTDHGGPSSVPCHELITWLDARKEGSVVYVSFGSRVVLTSKQMDELATGLEKSGVHFILCVRQPKEKQVASDYGEISKGFEDRVAGRGYIIKGWAPQVSILRHPAVGTFLTHCGWNSTLEGIAAGVMMLTWPMGAEQFLNAKLLVEQLRVGIQVGEGSQNIPKSAMLASLLAEAVNGSRPERLRAKELHDAVLGAVVKGGSSDKHLNEFVDSLYELK